jgi:antitoxin component of MazEF toxin-antitoxin module
VFALFIRRQNNRLTKAIMIRKKLTKNGNSYAMILDRAVLRLLQVKKTTIFEITVERGGIFLKPVGTHG